MSAEQIFAILNRVTLLAWLPLLFLPRKRWATSVVPVVMPALLAVVYVALVVASLPWGDGGFSSLAGVRALFANPYGLLAGWTHYLAFDLFIGGWEVRDAQQRGIPHLLVVPALVLTFLFGPAGCCSIWRFDGSPRAVTPARRDVRGRRRRRSHSGADAVREKVRVLRTRIQKVD
jgi:hypothetical protein